MGGALEEAAPPGPHRRAHLLAGQPGGGGGEGQHVGDRPTQIFRIWRKYFFSVELAVASPSWPLAY